MSAPFVVVGVDGSVGSDHALRWAARQAELTGMALRTVMACHVPTVAYGMAFPHPVLRDVIGDAHAILDHAVNSVLGAEPSIAVERVVVVGHAATELIKAADKADLLVVGSRGHGEIVGTLLGSVSQHCVTQADCPVVVVRDRNRPDLRDQGRQAGVDAADAAVHAVDPACQSYASPLIAVGAQADIGFSISTSAS